MSMDRTNRHEPAAGSMGLTATVASTKSCTAPDVHPQAEFPGGCREPFHGTDQGLRYGARVTVVEEVALTLGRPSLLA